MNLGGDMESEVITIWVLAGERSPEMVEQIEAEMLGYA